MAFGVGWGRANNSFLDASVSANGIGVGVGAGADVTVARHIAVRVVQVGYGMSWLEGKGRPLESFSFSSGVVLTF